MDPDGQVRLMNTIAEKFFTVAEASAFGRDLFAEQRDAAFVEAWQAFLAGEIEGFSQDLQTGGPGAPVYTVTVSSIKTADGRPAGCVAVLRDVTEERQLDLTNQEFLSSLTHELRTPLASIRGFTSQILHDNDISPEEHRRFLEIVEKEAQRLQQLLEDLFALSSIQSGQGGLQRKRENLSTLLHDARRSFAAAAQDKGVSLLVHIEGQDGTGIFDAEGIRRVLDNLISNAIKSTPSGGRIDAELCHEGERLECTVRDTGKGIAADVLDRIFDGFYSKRSGPTQASDTGLGLHIAQRIVTLHGGEISASSNTGDGSVFQFWIPTTPEKSCSVPMGSWTGIAVRPKRS
jgi:signal transduction histidine kinase